MKIIDLLNKKANGELDKDFSFAYDGYVWEYDKSSGDFYNKNADNLGGVHSIVWKNI